MPFSDTPDPIIDTPNTVFLGEADTGRPVDVDGLVKIAIWNHRTEKMDYIYSRYGVINGVPGLSLESELDAHREAILSEVLRNADDYLPNRVLDRAGAVEV